VSHLQPLYVCTFQRVKHGDRIAVNADQIEFAMVAPLFVESRRSAVAHFAAAVEVSHGLAVPKRIAKFDKRLTRGVVCFPRRQPLGDHLEMLAGRFDHAAALGRNLFPLGAGLF
jgi:hypothetical protein